MLIILYFLSVIIVTVGLVSVHVARRRTNLTVGTCILLFFYIAFSCCQLGGAVGRGRSLVRK